MGRHSFYFAESGFDVCSVDLSKSSIELIQRTAKEQGMKVKAIVSDMTDLPFGDAEFDCVICFHTIYHSDFKGRKRLVK
ncbi:MAG: class I SAM-dependent methyltransferase [Lachnospiraceae bacterium]|jgi:2-polyprenyl-3-methyl-5-hydroxy-6-metoxy-1,4-benzoquinol methylase|nr:class I SAM-dependent methyltransferase [Lachnospiraceae bacterium]